MARAVAPVGHCRPSFVCLGFGRRSRELSLRRFASRLHEGARSLSGFGFLRFAGIVLPLLVIVVVSFLQTTTSRCGSVRNFDSYVSRQLNILAWQ